MNASNPLITMLGMSQDGHEQKVMRLLLDLGIQSVSAEEGSLLVLDRETDELIFIMTVGNKTSESQLFGQRVPAGKGLVGRAALTHEVQIGSPVYKDVKQASSIQNDNNQPTAEIAAPMLIGDELTGVITAVSFKTEKRFTSADALLYGRIAAIAGVVVDQRRRLNALQAAHSSSFLTPPLTDRERSERKIMDVFNRIVSRDPSKLAAIAHLLEAAAELL
jgi:GAF domain-containing protein